MYLPKKWALGEKVWSSRKVTKSYLTGVEAFARNPVVLLPSTPVKLGSFPAGFSAYRALSVGLIPIPRGSQARFAFGPQSAAVARLYCRSVPPLQLPFVSKPCEQSWNVSTPLCREVVGTMCVTWDDD